MTAEIIELQFGTPAKREGNGAREALIELVILTRLSCCTSEQAADWILGEWYARGFKVVPL